MTIAAITSTNVAQLTFGPNSLLPMGSLQSIGPGQWQGSFPFSAAGLPIGQASVTLTLTATTGMGTTVCLARSVIADRTIMHKHLTGFLDRAHALAGALLPARASISAAAAHRADTDSSATTSTHAQRLRHTRRERQPRRRRDGQ